MQNAKIFQAKLWEEFDSPSCSFIQTNKHRAANSVAPIYLLRPPGAKW
jgi:hypothetical protein